MPNKGPTRRAARGGQAAFQVHRTRRYAKISGPSASAYRLATIHDERTVDCTIKVYNTNIYIYIYIYICACVYVCACVRKKGRNKRSNAINVSLRQPLSSTYTKCATQTLFVASLSRTESTSKRDNARQRSEASSELRVDVVSIFSCTIYIESCATFELYIKYLTRKINI